jgi:hypothetical protein
MRSLGDATMTQHARLPHFAIMALRRLFLPMARQRPPDVIIGGADNPYLKRWHLTPRGNDEAVYLHHFLRSDDDRALHDHPWPSLSVILEGAYLEHLPQGTALRVEGDLVQRTPEDAHRVELLRNEDEREKPVWTLFLVGQRVREWGFHCPKGWVHWRDFTSGEHGELIGRGCE